MSNENTKPQDAGTDSEQHPAIGIFSYVTGGVIGLVILVGLASILQGGDVSSNKTVEELPHLAIVVAYDDFKDEATRASLAELQRELVETGLVAIGPLNYPILIPGNEYNAKPTGKSIETITADEIDRAIPFLESGGWLIPRIYTPDMREAVIRVAPPGLQPFPSGSRREVESILDSYRGQFREVLAYSRALGMEDDDARNRINLNFGVQSASIRVIARDEGFLSSHAMIGAIHNAAKGLTTESVRSAVSTGSYVTYAWAVQSQSMGAGIGTQTPVKDILEQAEAWNVPLLLGKSGQEAWIEVYTEAEGAANAELCYFLAANYPKIDGLNYKVPRKKRLDIE